MVGEVRWTNLLSDFEGGVYGGEGHSLIDHRFLCKEMIIMWTNMDRGHL